MVDEEAVCKECTCCGVRRGDAEAQEAAGKVEAGRRMGDVSQGSVGGFFEIREMLDMLQERKIDKARKD